MSDSTLQFYHIYCSDRLFSVVDLNQFDGEERKGEDGPLTLEKNDFSLSSNTAVLTEGDLVSSIIVCLKKGIFVKTLIGLTFYVVVLLASHAKWEKRIFNTRKWIQGASVEVGNLSGVTLLMKRRHFMRHLNARFLPLRCLLVMLCLIKLIWNRGDFVVSLS